MRNRTRARRYLLRVGFDDVQGYLEDGIDAWQNHGFEIGSLSSISVPDLSRGLAQKNPPFVLDVRTEREWEGGHIEGAHHIHGGLLQERFDEIPRDRPVAVVCGTGYRGAIASSFLKREGFQSVSNLLGGMAAWTSLGLPTTND